MRAMTVAIAVLAALSLGSTDSFAQRGSRGLGRGVGTGPGLGGAAGVSGLGGVRTNAGTAVTRNPLGGLNARPTPGALNSVPNRTPDAHAATAKSWAVGGPAPFSPAWYANHPKAWHATHPYAGTVVTATTLAAFLAVPVIPVAGSGGSTTNVTIVSPAAEGSVPNEPLAAITPESNQADSNTWMNLGQYALGPDGSSDDTRRMQLAVNAEGLLRGTHYDTLSDDVQSVEGLVPKSTLVANWRIGQGDTVFECPLGELLEERGRVTVRRPSGASTTWQITRLAQ